MYSDFSIETAESVGTFTSYWNKIKSFIPDLLTLPGKIRGLQQEALGWAIKTKNEALKSQFKASSNRSLSMYDIAVDIKNKINSYLPNWQSQEKASGASGMWGFGIIPALIIGAVALGALAYVSVKGLSLLKQYQSEKSIMSDLKSKAISLEEAKTLIHETGRVSTGPTFVESITEKLTTPLMIPLLIGGGILAFMMVSKFRRT